MLPFAAATARCVIVNSANDSPGARSSELPLTNSYTN